MNSLELYQELCSKLNEVMSTEDLSIQQIVDRDYDDDMEDVLKFEIDGQTYDLTRNWDHQLDRYDEDKPIHEYWQIDSKDEYALHAGGWYDSWAGTTMDDHEFKVVKTGEIVKVYMTFTPV